MVDTQSEAPIAFGRLIGAIAMYRVHNLGCGEFDPEMAQPDGLFGVGGSPTMSLAIRCKSRNGTSCSLYLAIAHHDDQSTRAYVASTSRTLEITSLLHQLDASCPVDGYAFRGQERGARGKDHGEGDGIMRLC